MCCRCRCCKPCNKFREYVSIQRHVNGQKKEASVESVIVFEAALTKTVQLICTSSSWATAGILELACESVITNYNDFWGSWTYFGILLLSSFLYATYPQRYLIDDYQQLAKDLQLELLIAKQEKEEEGEEKEKTDEDINAGRRTTIKTYFELSKNDVRLSVSNINKNDNNSGASNDTNIKMTMETPLLLSKDKNKYYDKAMQAVNTAYNQVNILLQNLNILIVATLANVIALALLNAVDITTIYYGSTNWFLTSHWIAAGIVTLTTISLVIKLAIRLEKLEKKLINYVRENTIENSKKQILQFQLELCKLVWRNNILLI